MSAFARGGAGGHGSTWEAVLSLSACSRGQAGSAEFNAAMAWNHLQPRTAQKQDPASRSSGSDGSQRVLETALPADVRNSRSGQ